MNELLERLDALERRVAVVLREVPGATALACFGSRATASDGYADLDLQLISADLDAARAVWPAILARVGPVSYALRLDDRPDTTSYCVVFEEESPYHKLDISVCDEARAERSLAAQPHRWLWRQTSAAGSVPAPGREIFVPPHDSSGHLLLEELVSLVRYTKARRRGRHLTCWRFARAAFDTLLRLQAAGADGVPARLSTWDYVALDDGLGEEERLSLTAALDWATPAGMDRGRVLLAEAIITGARALTRAEVIPPRIEARTITFVRMELGVHERE
jgi:hypothetical protein